MRYLGVWLDSELIFSSHMNESVKIAQTSEIQIKRLTKSYTLAWLYLSDSTFGSTIIGIIWCRIVLEKL